MPIRNVRNTQWVLQNDVSVLTSDFYLMTLHLFTVPDPPRNGTLQLFSTFRTSWKVRQVCHHCSLLWTDIQGSLTFSWGGFRCVCLAVWPSLYGFISYLELLLPQCHSDAAVLEFFLEVDVDISNWEVKLERGCMGKGWLHKNNACLLVCIEAEALQNKFTCILLNQQLIKSPSYCVIIIANLRGIGCLRAPIQCVFFILVSVAMSCGDSLVVAV